MSDKKKSLAEKLADEARRQYEEGKTKEEIRSRAESMMADVEAKLKAHQPKLSKAAEAQAKAESLMDDLTAKLKARQPKSAASAAHQDAAPEIYEVQPGDSLSKIAKEVYGDMNRWSDIFEANKDQIENPNLIQIGQKLIIPR